MTRSLFGTDGVRGRANVELTPDMAMRLARAAMDGKSGVAVVGRDPRRSGQMLGSAVHAGFNAAGIDTIDLGVIPVGGVSHFIRERRATLGVMVSASHNPAADNGIKFMGRDGAKLDDDQERDIEARYHEGSVLPVEGEAIGMQIPLANATQGYVDALAERSRYGLSGLRVALDCANGAAFAAAPALFEGLGADVEAHATEPTGTNINDGVGAVHPEFLADRTDGAIGLAFDGDADRLIAIDENGGVCNGDVVMAIIARHLHAEGRLDGDLVVATVMSNLGFRRALESIGVRVAETQVGDRYVLQEMAASGAGLGGEQSGHVIFGGEPTGDGLLTGMRLLEVVAATGTPLSELRRFVVEYPQVLRNVRVRTKDRLPDADRVWEAVRSAEKRLGDDGRILVRASGTEPLVRVMVEAAEQAEAAAVAESVAGVVVRELGGLDEPMAPPR